MQNFLAINPALRQSWQKGTVTKMELTKYFELTSDLELAALVADIRQTDNQEERRKLKAQLPFRCPHYFSFKGNCRRQDCILPEEFTFQTCVDIDRMEDVEPALQRAYELDRQEGMWQGHLLHVERSASNKLHIDIRIPVGMTIEEAQRAYTSELGVDFDADCCSPERMIYITDSASQLYTSKEWYARMSDEELALRRKAYADRGLDIDGRKAPSCSPCLGGELSAVVTPPKQEGQGEVFPTEYKGIAYKDIVEELADQLGGAPEHGSRNNFIFTMSCHLRHVCNDDPRWIRQILPNYGEDQQRVDATIESACKRVQSAAMPRVMEMTLELCRRRLSLDSENEKASLLAQEPQMPEQLPAPVRLLVSKAPKMYHPAIATAIFPALATHMSDVKLEYWSNEEMEPALMTLLLAEFSGGKSSIKKPIEIILEKLEKEGCENRKKQKEWRDEVNSKGANKDKPLRPEGQAIQVVDSDMTNAALVQLLENNEMAGGRRMFTLMDELSMLKKVGNGSIEEVTQIVRRAFDTDLYGQERVGAQSVQARIPLRWNFVASSTQKYAVGLLSKQIGNGTFSRLNLCTIIEDKSVDYPVFGKYDDRLRTKLKPYIELLSEAHGLLVCPQAKRLCKELVQIGKDRAALMDDESYNRISRRAVVIAFRKAMILWVMNGRKWSKPIEDFVSWSYNYDMWCKMRLFGEPMQQQLEQERRVIHPGTPNMLEMLPESFTREHVAALRRKLGKKENPREQLAQWICRGFIVQNEQTQEYVKTEKYMQRHVA